MEFVPEGIVVSDDKGVMGTARHAVSFLNMDTAGKLLDQGDQPGAICFQASGLVERDANHIATSGKKEFSQDLRTRRTVVAAIFQYMIKNQQRVPCTCDHSVYCREGIAVA